MALVESDAIEIQNASVSLMGFWAFLYAFVNLFVRTSYM